MVDNVGGCARGAGWEEGEDAVEVAAVESVREGDGVCAEDLLIIGARVTVRVRRVAAVVV